MAGSGLDEVKSLLASTDSSSLPSIFPSLISTPAFHLNSTGVCAQVVCFLQTDPAGDSLSCEFMKFLFETPCETAVLKRSALDFFLLWVRSSSPWSLEAQISILESLATQIRAFLELEPGNPNPSLAVAQLIERSSLYVLPTAVPFFEQTCDSRSFITRSPEFIRSHRASQIRGRLHLLAARLFPPNSTPQHFLPAKKSVFPSRSSSEVRLPKALEALAKGGTVVDSLRISFQVVEQFLASATWIPVQERIPRPLTPIFAAFEALQSPSEPQDPAVLLQIAIMCLIIQPINPKVIPLLRKFAVPCGVDADLVLRLVQEPLGNEALPSQEMEIPPAMPSEPMEFVPLLEPFELEPEPEIPANPQPSVDGQIEELAGKDPSRWFDGDELTKWRVARLCVANFFDRLDPDSFSILPAKTT
jgi:hypothetical protein